MDSRKVPFAESNPYPKTSKWSEGDLEEWLRTNERFIHETIKKYKKHFKNYDELFNLGREGIWKASLSYDPNKMVKFTTYATPIIQNIVKMALRYEHADKRDPSKTVSLEDFCSTRTEDGETRLDQYDFSKDDFLHEPEIPIDKRIENNERIVALRESINRVLYAEEKQIIGYWLEGKSQHEIAIIKGYSDTKVSSTIAEIKLKLLRELRIKGFNSPF